MTTNFSIQTRLSIIVVMFSAFILPSGVLQSAPAPPPLPREFRGAWIATVHNINWPSKPGLSADRQKAELIKILDTARQRHLNAVVLQIRPACDALYQSSIEPWSVYLTGRMGTSPGYDPLTFAVEQAHLRGLELHAWFNPFRAMASKSVSASSSHVTKTHPDAVRSIYSYKWLDPGLPFSSDRALAVVRDVLKRYDIDGVHIDDYFYPYPNNPSTGPAPFDDDASYALYTSGGGSLERADWRRANIDAFVQALYQAIKSEKPWVKFGVSPFGIYRPGHPESIDAELDSYAHIFADSRKWLHNGWCDYFTPQLYWRIDDKPHSFSTLFAWWDGENRARRHIWPGIASDRIAKSPDYRGADETLRQVDIARSGKTTAPGHIHWSIAPIMENRKGVAASLAAKSYADLALVPASPWLSRNPPARPPVRVETGGSELSLPENAPSAIAWWAIQIRSGSQWQLSAILHRSQSSFTLPPDTQAVAVTAIDRYGNASPPTILESR